MRTTGAALLAWGCSGTAIRGEIADERPDIDDAAFYERRAPDDNDDQLVVLVGPRDICTSYATFYEEVADAAEDLDWIDPDSWDAAAERLVDTWVDLFPESFWFGQLVLQIDDADESVEGTTLEGLDYDETADDDEQFYGTLEWFQEYPDEDEMVAYLFGQDASFVARYATDDGETIVTRHLPGEALGGRYEGHASTRDGARAGDIEIRFAAVDCPEAEEVFEDGD